MTDYVASLRGIHPDVIITCEDGFIPIGKICHESADYIESLLDSCKDCIPVKRGSDVKYIHLMAWDIMMGSSAYWIDDNQERAKSDKAPFNAIYHQIDPVTQQRKWKTFDDIESDSTRERINRILRDKFNIP